MGKILKDETQILALGKWLGNNLRKKRRPSPGSLGPSELTRGDAKQKSLAVVPV